MPINLASLVGGMASLVVCKLLMSAIAVGFVATVLAATQEIVLAGIALESHG